MPIKAINGFPPGFLWGCATAAHQVEGNNKNDWWRWEQTPGHIFQNQTAGAACEWWSGRYEEDFDRAAEMHNNAHRLSVEWSRIEPEPGKWDEAALERYRAMLQTLHTRGMTPMVTLHHFTNPLWVADKMGWVWDEIPVHFERFVRKVVEKLGDLCSLWCTINEPMVYITLGHVLGERPPGQKSLRVAARAGANLLRGHAAAYHAIKELQPASKIGFAHSYVGLSSRPPHLINRFAAKTIDNFYNLAFLRAFLDGVLKFPGARAITIPALKDTLDWVGIQYYQELWAGFSPGAPRALFMTQSKPTNMQVGPGTWGGIQPGAIYRYIARLWKFLGKPIYITETGVPDPDDTLRPAWIAETVKAAWHALGYGYPVHGLFFWSLVDNFEWLEGYDPRFSFGLYKVDFQTQERTARPSARFYGEICAQNGMTPEMVERHVPSLLGKLYPEPTEGGKNNVKLKASR